jgi:hypothetical protein
MGFKTKLITTDTDVAFLAIQDNLQDVGIQAEIEEVNSARFGGITLTGSQTCPCCFRRDRQGILPGNAEICSGGQF